MVVDVKTEGGTIQGEICENCNNWIRALMLCHFSYVKQPQFGGKCRTLKSER